MARRRGSYTPFKDGQTVTLKDGREGRITAQRHAHHDIEVEIAGQREWLKWEDVVREQSGWVPNIISAEGWQMTGNMPGMGKK